MLSRVERTKYVREKAIKDWPFYWFNWLTSPELGLSISYPSLSTNPNLTLDVVDANPGVNWSWQYISELPCLKFNDVLSRLNKPWDWFALSYNLELTIDEVRANLHLNWDWGGLSVNNCFTFTDIIENMDLPWKLNYINTKKDLTLDDIRNNPDLPWNYYYLSASKILTIDFIKSVNLKYWNWAGISCNPAIKMKDIIDNPDLPWRWSYVVGNPNITIDFILEHEFCQAMCIKVEDKNGKEICIKDASPNKGINLSTNKGISITDIIKHAHNPNLCWKWDYISNRKDVTLDLVLENPELPWVYEDLVSNISWDLDFLKKNIHKLGWNVNWNKLQANYLRTGEQDFLISRAREHLAAYRIQQHWHRIRADPRHPIGIKRLETDYIKLFESA